MSTDHIDDHPDGNVVQLRPATPAEAPAAHVPEPEPGKRLPVIPEHLRRENIKDTARQAAGLQAHRTAYHGVRFPVYLARIIAYAIRGAARLTGRLLTWWHWSDGWVLESQAVAAGRAGHADAMRAHTQGLKTRGTRGRIVAVCVVLAIAAALAMTAWLPWQGLAALAALVVLVLARYGKPAGKPIVTAAVVPPKYEAPSPEVITRALGSLGIPGINAAIKDGPGITFVSDVHRDGPGWGAQLDLPYGVTVTQILARREELASGLRRPLSATWPAPVAHEHAGRLELWIGFHDISKAKPPVWPLLRAGDADVFVGLPFGTDPRGKGVTVPMFEVNWLVGASPGQGKTAAVRVLACGAALDPLADLWIHELAGKGDLEPLARCCHRYTSGLDDESIAYTARSLSMLRSELDRRSAAFKRLPRDAKPEGKVTRDLAGRRGLRLRPLVCVIDEAQNCFMHPTFGAKAADDAAYVIRLGRAYGIIVILATQRPDRESLPPAIRGIVTARFCLKVPDYDSNDMILGTGSYKAGYNSAIFRAKTDAGLGWLKGDGDPQVVRTYYLDLNAAERVANRARGIREAAGVLSGYALGQDDDGPARSFPADVLTVFGADSKLWTETIAARLRESIPDAYADITQDAVASQLRALGVPVKDVRENGSANRKGCERAAVEAVAGVVGV